MSKVVRTSHDPSIVEYMKEEVQVILQNDQICFRESEDSESSYQQKLAIEQKRQTQPLFDFLQQ